ncbi:MAG: AzlD domain-containing protein [Mycobacteriaceae bacterium]|jgi:branched-subunit amino acid transport protein
MWPLVLIASVGCYALKLAGHSVSPRVLDRPRVRRIAALLPLALLAALVAVQTFGSGQTLVVDARLPGVVAAAVALVLRAPFLVVVAVAGVVAAGLRYAGLAA